LYSLLHPRNVTGFSYRKVCDRDAKIFMTFQPLKSVEGDFEKVLGLLGENRYCVSDVSDNYLAKTHVRYMSGGRRGRGKAGGKGVSNDSDKPRLNERLFRIKFPESPGALERFLNSLKISWNVSLFHYRNHGDDFGRVLVGLECEWGEDGKLMDAFLDEVGFSWVEETSNDMYEGFLK